jgi:glucose-1-phosphate cytidylyltransferase
MLFLATPLMCYARVSSLVDLGDIPVVILAGGRGFRMREITEAVPKALAPIGPMPIIVHVMHIYGYFGYRQFVICAGYKGDTIKEFFMSDYWKSTNLRIRLGKETAVLDSDSLGLDGAEITFVDTGLERNTGGRIKKIEKFIETDQFLANYCDGLSDVDIRKVHEFHREMGRIATLVAVKPMSRYGVVTIRNGLAASFREKPVLDDYINGGYFVFDRRVFDYLDDNCVLEREPLQRLAKEGQLAAYKHDGFWFAMDTYKEFEELNSFWETGVMPTIGYKGKPPWLRSAR